MSETAADLLGLLKTILFIKEHLSLESARSISVEKINNVLKRGLQKAFTLDHLYQLQHIINYHDHESTAHVTTTSTEQSFRLDISNRDGTHTCNLYQTKPKGKRKRTKNGEKIIQQFQTNWNALLLKFHGNKEALEKDLSKMTILQPPSAVVANPFSTTTSPPDLDLRTIEKMVEFMSSAKGSVPDDGIYEREAREATFANPNEPYLYKHQKLALDAIEQGRHVIVSTGTASGKSLIYQTAILNQITSEPNATALLLFPTKALSRDQLGKFRNTAANEIVIDCLDGDVAKEQRNSIRSNVQILLTNPDTLHVSILPHHALWKGFLSNLKYIVIDEAHSYENDFGLALKFLLSRLKRLIHLYSPSAAVQFIGCSATLPNSKMVALHLFSCGEEELTVIDKDYSPMAKRYQVLWTTKGQDGGVAATATTSTKLEEASYLLSLMISNGHKSICFCTTRAACELVLQMTRTKLSSVMGKGEFCNLIESYRAGYTAQERWILEQQLFSGSLLGVVSTSALELGVDIGCFDVVVHVGFSSYSSYRQSMGRCGRRGKTCLSIFIAEPNSAFAKNPPALFHHPAEEAQVALVKSAVSTSVSLHQVLRVQLNCAAIERPICPVSDAAFFLSPSILLQFEDLLKEHLRFDSAFNLYVSLAVFKDEAAFRNPIRRCKRKDQVFKVFVESCPATNSCLVLLEEVELERVPFEIFHNAILVFRGVSYLIFKVNMNLLYCIARPTLLSCYTRANYCNSFNKIDALGNVGATTRPRTVYVSRGGRDGESSGTVAITIGNLIRLQKHIGYHQIDPITGHVLQSVNAPFHDTIESVVYGASFILDLFEERFSLESQHEASFRIIQCMVKLFYQRSKVWVQWHYEPQNRQATVYSLSNHHCPNIEGFVGGFSLLLEQAQSYRGDTSRLTFGK